MYYVVVIEKAAHGSYSAYVPDLPGCVACGDTPGEVRQLIAVAVTLHIESLREHGDPVPRPSATTDVVRVAKLELQDGEQSQDYG
jgi:predicted RNase H-like HicB family nuclease